MAYTYEQVFAADPSNPSNVAQNASITIFEPGDGTMTPLTITDPDGQPLANPIPVNANGFGSAFAHATLDRVAWAGGGFTGFFTSYEGMKQVALDAQAAAETAAATAGAEAAVIANAAVSSAVSDAATAATAATTAAADAATAATSAAEAAALVGAPADTAIAAAINGTGTSTKAALDAKIATAVAAIPTAVSDIIPAADISTWGDSITESGQGGGIKWPELLSDWLRVSVYNGAISGEGPADIATRQGGLAPKITLTGNSIPAEVTPVTATLVDPGFGWRENAGSGVPRIGNFKGRLAGIPGTLLHSQTTGTWTFTRTTAGTATSVPANTRFYTDYGKNQRDSIQIIWAGRNYPSQAEVLRDVASMVGQVRSGKYLVLGILTTGTEITGGGGHTTIKAINAQLATIYGDKFFDMRTYLRDYGLSQMGITPTTQDTTDIANDTVPASLRDDNTHPNKYGIQAIGRRLARLIIDKGWSTVPKSEIPGIDDTNPGLFLPTVTAYATHPADATMQGLQDFSIRTALIMDAFTGQSVNIVNRAVGTGNQRSWVLQTLTTGVLRFQVSADGVAWTNCDSSVALPYTNGTTIGLRVDVNDTANTATFYTSTDYATAGAAAVWTQLGTSPSTGPGSVYVGTAPLQVGSSTNGPKGRMLKLELTSRDGATVHYANDFRLKDADDVNWTLFNGAYMTPA